METLGIREEDIEEKFVRSSGSGGQNVNKVSTCVVLRHRPTGIQVKCQIERSQALNRFLARRILVERINQKICGIESKAQKNRWRLKKQKAKRSKRAKEKMLANKRHQSEKKALRAKKLETL